VASQGGHPGATRYMLRADTGESVEFMYAPESFDDSMSTDWSDESLVSCLKALEYKDGASREVSFTVFPTDGIKPGLIKEVRNSQGLIGRNLFETNLS